MSEMTSKTLGTIVEHLLKGNPLPRALDAAGMTYAHFETCCRLDPDIREAIAEALEQCSRDTPAEVQANWSSPNAVDQAPDEPDEPEEPEPIDPSIHCPLNKEQVAAEALELGPGMFGYLMWVDEHLSGFGMPRMSPWWKFTLQSFYESLKRWLVALVGRGGGKSTTLCRVAGTEALFEEREVPPGQRWLWPFISIALPDANRRIIEIHQILEAIGIRTEIKRTNGRPSIELVDINHQKIEFMSLASTIAGVSGPSTIGCIVDEEAKLKDRITNANPASEILASLLQTFRMRHNIHGIRCSSAWTSAGVHAQSIRDGDNAVNFIARIGEQFLESVMDGLHEVATYEQQQGNKEGYDRILKFCRTVDAKSPCVPSWLANPTMTAIGLRTEVEALPADALDGYSRTDYWLRENASMSLDPKGQKVITLDQLRGLADANRRINAPRNSGGLAQFDGLSSYDPRSVDHRGPGSGRCI